MVFQNSDHICSYCERPYASEYSLKQHIERVHLQTQIKEYRCETCFKTFKHKKSLKAHMLRHNSEPKFKCDLCEKSYYTEKLMSLHREIHFRGNERPKQRNFMCKICAFKKEVFPSHRDLRNHHELMHPGVQDPFPCEFCERTFVLRETLLKHYESKHFIETGKTYDCDQCGKPLGTAKRLKHHVQTIHEGKRFHCPFCSTPFTFKSKFIKHYKIKHAPGTVSPQKLREISSLVEFF